MNHLHFVRVEKVETEGLLVCAVNGAVIGDDDVPTIVAEPVPAEGKEMVKAREQGMLLIIDRDDNVNSRGSHGPSSLR